MTRKLYTGRLVDVSFDYQGAEAVEFLGTPSTDVFCGLPDTHM